MGRLWRFDHTVRGPKYLVVRRDGSIPPWEWFVLGAADRNAPAALYGYADEADRNGLDPLYTTDIRAMAFRWKAAQLQNLIPAGDPAAPRHRTDDLNVTDLMDATKNKARLDECEAFINWLRRNWSACCNAEQWLEEIAREVAFTLPEKP